MLHRLEGTDTVVDMRSIAAVQRTENTLTVILKGGRATIDVEFEENLQAFEALEAYVKAYESMLAVKETNRGWR